jgi:methylthioribose-1-phosphate isomerase
VSRRGPDGALARALRALGRDRRSGATALGRRAARLLAAAARADGRSLARWRRDVRRVGLAVVTAQPAMASLVIVVDAAFRAAERAADVATGARAVRAAVRRAAGDPGALAAIGTRLGVIAPRRGRWVTLSWSESVLRALVAARPREVVVAESLPGGEGRRLARRLRARGVAAAAVADLRAVACAATADAVMVGADAVTPDAVWNKVGTHALALAARAAAKPVYVVTPSNRLVPAALASRIADRPGGLFEATPLGLVSRVVTETGVLRPGDVRRRARTRVARTWSRR